MPDSEIKDMTPPEFQRSYGRSLDELRPIMDCPANKGFR